MKFHFKVALLSGAYVLMSCSSTTSFTKNNLSVYVSIEELRLCNHLPIDCKSKVEMEGQPVFVSGYVDWPNVFNKKNNPQLPYEKFKIRDLNGNNTIEIWVEAIDSGIIFEKLYQIENFRTAKVNIKGILSAFNMNAAGKCVKYIKITLVDAADITIIK